MLPRICNTIVFLLGVAALPPRLLAEECPRPPIGGAVLDPPSLNSAGGTLRVNFNFRSGTGRYGSTLYCYISREGAQSPTLRVHPGDELVLTLKNDLPAAPAAHVHGNRGDSGDSGCTGGAMSASSTNFHFHGLAVPPSCHQDEVLRTLIQPGDPAFEYHIKIPANEASGLYWYHPHPHGYSESQVLGGASGALIVEGIERAVPRVAGLPERVLVLRDEAVPGLAADAEDAGPGKNISINYVPVMYPLYRPASLNAVPSQREFWRVLNASADTYFDLQVRFGSIIQEIQDVQTLDLVALDGVPIGADQATAHSTHILLAPGARAEFIVTTPPQGMLGQLVTLNYSTGPDGAATPFRAIANIRPNEGAPPISAMPSAPAQPEAGFHGLTALKPARTRRLYFSEELEANAGAGAAASQNGTGTAAAASVVPAGSQVVPKAAKYYITVEGATPKVFDMNFTRPDIEVKQGTVEDWVIENRAKEAHVFHIHQLHFQVLERDGRKVNEAALRDTVDLPFWDGQSAYPSVKLRMDFRSPNIVGTFVYHCHILEHEDGGMMGVIRVNRR